MATGDIYELTLQGKLLEQEVNNVFHYEQDTSYVSTAPTIAYDVYQSFNQQVMPKIVYCATYDMQWTKISVRNLFNPSDAHDELISTRGFQGGDATVETLPPFAAITFNGRGNNPAVAGYSKRFTAVSEAWQQDGILLTSGGVLTNLQNLADQLPLPLKSYPLMLSELFIPVIVKRVREGTPGAYTYRLPSSPAEKIVSQLLVVTWDLLVSTQLSRKVGKGR